MFAIISILLIASASALNLPPASFSAITNQDFYYQVSVGESIPGLTNKISGIQGALGFNDPKYLEQIGGDLKFHIDAMQSTPYRSLTWSLTIKRHLGVLRVIQVTAVINSGTLHINGKFVEVTQSIPPVFNVTRVCHKGGRKYGIAGPRKEHCEDVRTQRGLNGDEIAQVQQALMNMIPHAQARLN